MTGFQAFTPGTAALQDLDPYRFPAASVVGESEGASTVCGEAGDYFQSAPTAPASRLSALLEPADRRRLELHAALTTAGIAPLPGDLDAIETLCTLDDATHAVLRRWISHGV
ncbi:hypothetical protein ACIGO8_13070 [Streptomyces sp. NPDC053493]|uniref:hypothetical protein n=1 Tax=Streptomyces sp. NPDC053493 TaxID=3365705 RepID=UPI0037CF21C3